MGKETGELGWPPAAILSTEVDGRVELKLLYNEYLAFKMGKSAGALGWPPAAIFLAKVDGRVEL
jgi:hypothetical protein